MPEKVTAWKCAYCRRYRRKKAAIVSHEAICFHNPNRKVLEGQMAVFETMPRELTVVNSYGVPDSDWLEPNDSLSDQLREKYKWWPLDEDGCLGLGYVYREGAWHKIPGYIPPHFAPGCSWRDEYIPEKEADHA